MVQQGVSNDEERDLILKFHNQLRAKIANGLEERGDPGPQPTAANMMEMVRLFRSCFLAITLKTPKPVSFHQKYGPAMSQLIDILPLGSFKF